MYLLLVGVHSVFFFISYLLSDILMQGAFVLLLIFFLLYFSPLFFFKQNHIEKSWISIPDINISPQKSIFIPLILTYIGIYVLVFTVTRDLGANFNLHLYIFLLIFLILWGYIFTFNWNTTFFHDILRFHLICSYITILAQFIYFFIFSGDITILHLIFSFVTIGFSVFFFTYFNEENVNMFLAFILSCILSTNICILFIFRDLHIFTILWITGIISIIIFEYFPKIQTFIQFLESTRILLLTILLCLCWILMISPFFSYFYFVWFLSIFSIYLFSIHIRYSNYISYSIAIITLFYLYTYLFSPLLLLPDLLSSLLFIFFFSLCIIGNTYFWEERDPYDFSFLHYSSIGYSIITALYSLIFVAWWGAFTLFFACSLFLLAILFLLSYFRFQYR